MRFAPGAWSFSLPFFAGAAAAVWLASPVLAGVLALLGVGVVLFHRDPERTPGPGVVAPSDGRVAESANGPAGAFLGTFLNVHNVHVARAPVAGRVLEVRRLDGPKLPAWGKKAGHNAGAEIRIQSDIGEVRVRMLVGFVARRVIPYVKEGDTLAKGDRIGLIRFGSRTELVLPPRARLVVRPGQTLHAGETTVAEVRP